ncbi:hypothetical protein HY994_01610 [Candidatus Micrarchaeota archaeon]|nr:hypothetical protein [Candidatus Micrarchaeota archaeon]
MASKDSKHPNAKSAIAGLSPLQLGLIVAALIVVIGLAYVVLAQAPAGKPTPTPSATAIVPFGNATPTVAASGNFSLPKSAVLTGNASCSNGSKMQVLLFTDPYCPACIASDPQVNSFYQKYQNKADVRYRFVSTHSRTISPVYGIDTVYRAFDYFVCAQEQGKIQEFKKCFYGNLTLQNGDYIPETKEQLQGCAKAVELEQTSLDACLLGARTKVDAAIVQAASFGGGTFFTPMAVVDCQVRVNSALVQQTYCAVSNAC